MTPGIFIYEEGKIILTPEALMISEIKRTISKFGEEAALPYLTYAHLMTYPYSPFINFEKQEKEDTCIYEVKETIGEFDIDDPILEPLIKKLTELYHTPLSLYKQSLDNLMHKIRKFLDETEISNENFADISRNLKDAQAQVKAYLVTKQAAEEELKAKARGTGKIGDY